MDKNHGKSTNRARDWKSVLKPRSGKNFSLMDFNYAQHANSTLKNHHKSSSVLGSFLKISRNHPWNFRFYTFSPWLNLLHILNLK